MSKNAIQIHPQKMDMLDAIANDFSKLVEAKNAYHQFLLEIKDSLIRDCSLIGGSAMVRDKIDKFLKENK